MAGRSPKQAGRVPDGTGLSSPTEPASSLGPPGFDPSRVSIETKYIVACGSAGIAPYPTFDDEAEAVTRFEEELAVPSYFGAGHYRRASIIKVTTVTEVIREGGAPAPLLTRDSDGSPKGGDAVGGSVACDDSAGRQASPNNSDTSESPNHAPC